MSKKALTLLLINLVLIHCDDYNLNIYDQTSGPNSNSACGDENAIADVAFIKMGTYSKFLDTKYINFESINYYF